MTNNIMALIDFSEVTNPVVKRAGELAGFYEAKCWLIHVSDPDPDFVGYEIGPQYVRDHKAAELQEEHSKLQNYKREVEQKGVDCEALLIQGQIHPTITGELKKLNIDLVVLGSHGHSELYDLLVGSVCRHVLKHHDIPMVIIPSSYEESQGG